MEKTTIVVIKNYHPLYIEDYDMHASITSFRLDLREVMKQTNRKAYFSPSPVEGPKNMGCYLFGQPNVWKGVIGILPEGNVDINTIEVYADFRNILKLEKLQKILSPALKELTRRIVIDDYELK